MSMGSKVKHRLPPAEAGGWADRLHQGIRRDIAAGRLRPGQRLPTERAYAEHYGLSVGTIRRAFDRLVMDRLVERQHGRGCFVVDAAHHVRRTVSVLAFHSLFDGGITPFFLDLCRMIGDALKNAGLGVQHVCVREAAGGEKGSGVICLCNPPHRRKAASVPRPG